MRRFLISTFGLASLIFLIPSMHAQAVPTATRSGDLQAGAGITYLNTDYAPMHNAGVSFWGDFDFLRFFHTVIGVEGEGHLTGIDAPDDIGENSYMAGVRAVYKFHSKYQIVGKFMGGRATISNQLYNTSSSFNVYAYGGGLDYHIARKYKIRAEVEEQKWPNFEPHTLSPITASIGVLYVIR